MDAPPKLRGMRLREVACAAPAGSGRRWPAVGLAVALAALAGLWVWERHGATGPEGVLPEVDATSRGLAQPVTDAQFQQAVQDIKRRLRPDEAGASGGAAGGSGARARQLAERSDQLQGALDATRRERDRLLAENEPSGGIEPHAPRPRGRSRAGASEGAA